MNKELLEYFNGDELSASVWLGKYALKDNNGKVVENTPADMHWRMAKELAKAQRKHSPKDQYVVFSSDIQLSDMGRELATTLNDLPEDALTEWIFGYLDRFKYIIPQGSIMSALGNRYKLQSLSNCFVVPAPYDSYGGIFKTDQEIAQLEKRRGGVGTNLNSLRPDDTPVANAAGTSTGAHSFMDRYSNTTREVAQNGRRGALMLLMDVRHPDIFKFVTKKKDKTKVTGANISSQLTDKFMQAVEKDEDFYCRFPIDMYDEDVALMAANFKEYNRLYTVNFGGLHEKAYGKQGYVMKIRARELFDLIVEMAWDNAEPGVAFMDRVKSYCPEGVYSQFIPVACNPCGEQWLNIYDACRLLAANLYSIVVNAFKEDAYIDYNKCYDIFYIQQWFADLIVDLEIEYINNIIRKIDEDPEPEDVKATERNLWVKVRDTASASRRTGCGFTAMADMIAALDLKYDSDEALAVVEKVMKTKMRAELDCTIDLAALRGTFDGWDKRKEFSVDIKPMMNGSYKGFGKNPFYQMLWDEYQDQAMRMWKYGRRNVSWSTLAPTGSVSIVGILDKYSNTSGGMEPVFAPFYFRNKKVNPSDKDVRVDFKDQNGDSWQTYPVMMGGFKEWLSQSFTEEGMQMLSKTNLEDLFKVSPYYGSCANDISWKKRVEMQAILQKYTTNAISSTLNLPKDVTKETVAGIYFEAWKQGLKGITIYRDGCRTGVMVTDNSNTNTNKITYNDAPKRPKELNAELTITTVKGNRYAVVIGFLDGKPYEVFAFNADEKVKSIKGKIVKQDKGAYDFINENGGILDDIQQSKHADEQVLTRLVSGMMRHGVNPKFIYEQISKCPLEIVSFGKALARVIKKYIPEKELVEGQKCKDCGSTNVRLQEGCLTCNECGSSKCG